MPAGGLGSAEVVLAKFAPGHQSYAEISAALQQLGTVPRGSWGDRLSVAPGGGTRVGMVWWLSVVCDGASAPVPRAQHTVLTGGARLPAARNAA